MVLVLFIHFATIILEVQGGTENVFDARINQQTSCRRRKTGVIRGFMQQYCHFQCIILVMPIDGSCRPTRQTQLLFKKATTMAPVRAASSDISHQTSIDPLSVTHLLAILSISRCGTGTITGGVITTAINARNPIVGWFPS